MYFFTVNLSLNSQGGHPAESYRFRRMTSLWLLSIHKMKLQGHERNKLLQVQPGALQIWDQLCLGLIAAESSLCLQNFFSTLSG